MTEEQFGAKILDDETMDETAEPTDSYVEEYEISGDKVIAKVKELVHEGNVRRISLKTEEGKTLIEIPFNIGVAGAVVGALVAPVWAAIGAIAAMVVKLRVVVDRVE
jgi:hypothetical protein